jgi:hypothetical protein
MQADYQDFKLLWLSVLPITKDAIHIYIGFLALLVALIVFRRRITSYWALVPGLVVSLAMEVFDLRDGFGWGASLKDLVNTNLIPLLLVQLARWRLIRQ